MHWRKKARKGGRRKEIYLKGRGTNRPFEKKDTEITKKEKIQ